MGWRITHDRGSVRLPALVRRRPSDRARGAANPPAWRVTVRRQAGTGAQPTGLVIVATGSLISAQAHRPAANPAADWVGHRSALAPYSGERCARRVEVDMHCWRSVVKDAPARDAGDQEIRVVIILRAHSDAVHADE